MSRLQFATKCFKKEMVHVMPRLRNYIGVMSLFDLYFDTEFPSQKQMVQITLKILDESVLVILCFRTQ